MKEKLKLLLILFIFSIFSFQAFAESCENGRIVTGVNGHEYCLSKTCMNWWTAFSWCEMQGRHLASAAEACDIDNNEKWSKGKPCKNNTGTFSGSRAWLSILINDRPIALSSTHGQIVGIPPTDSSYTFTLCW